MFKNNVIPAVLIAGEEESGKNIFSRMQALNVPNVSIAMIENGAIKATEEYTLSNKTVTNKPLLFQAASISKTINAVLALKLLVEANKLGLDEDVNPYLKDWKIPNSEQFKEKVTLRRLLSHTAGLTVSGFDGYSSTVKTLPTLIQILDGNTKLENSVAPVDLAPEEVNSAPVKIIKEPGSECSYSGGGTTIVQKLIEDITGESYAALAKQHIFEPLEMTSSSFEIKFPEQTGDNIEEGHLANGEVVPGRWHNYPESAAAGLWTTVEDLAKFNIAVQKAFCGENSQLLTKKMAQEMLTKQPNSRFGLGFEVSSFDNEPKFVFKHSGGNEGYRCRYIGLPNQLSGIVIMTNSDNGGMLVDEILRGAYKEYPGIFTSEQKIPVELDVKILNKCVGEFTIPKFDFMTVGLSVEQGHLFFTYPYPDPKSEKIKIELTPESATTFFNIEKGVEIKFSDDYSVLNLFGTKATRVSMQNTLLSQSGKYKTTDDLPSETVAIKDDRLIKDDSDIVGLNRI